MKSTSKFHFFHKIQWACSMRVNFVGVKSSAIVTHHQCPQWSQCSHAESILYIVCRRTDEIICCYRWSSPCSYWKHAFNQYIPSLNLLTDDSSNHWAVFATMFTAESCTRPGVPNIKKLNERIHLQPYLRVTQWRCHGNLIFWKIADWNILH